MKAVTVLMEALDAREADQIVAAGLLGMHERIAQTLLLWEVTEAPDAHAAALCRLSALPQHRRAGNEYWRSAPYKPRERIFEDHPGLWQFNALSEITRPGMTELWHRGELGQPYRPEDET